MALQLLLIGISAFYIWYFVGTQVGALQKYSPWTEDPYSLLISYATLSSLALFIIVGIRYLQIRQKKIIQNHEITLLLRTGASLFVIISLAVFISCIPLVYTPLLHEYWFYAYLGFLGILALLVISCAAKFFLLVREYLPLKGKRQPNDFIGSISKSIRITPKKIRFVQKYQILLVVGISAIFAMLCVAWQYFIQKSAQNIKTVLLLGSFAAFLPVLGYLIFNKYLIIVKNARKNK